MDIVDKAQEHIEQFSEIPITKTHGKCNSCHQGFSLDVLGSSGLCDDCFYEEN